MVATTHNCKSFYNFEVTSESGSRNVDVVLGLLNEKLHEKMLDKPNCSKIILLDFYIHICTSINTAI